MSLDYSYQLPVPERATVSQNSSPKQTPTPVDHHGHDPKLDIFSDSRAFVRLSDYTGPAIGLPICRYHLSNTAQAA